MFDRKILKARAKATLSYSYPMILVACVIVNVITSLTLGIFSGRLQKLQNINWNTIPGYRFFLIAAIVIVMALIVLSLAVMIISPLRVGLKRFLLNNENRTGRLDDLLFPFRANYKNIVLTLLLKNVIITLWSLLGYIPILIGFWKFDLADKIILLSQNVNDVSASDLASLSGTVAILGITTLLCSVPSVIKYLQYSLTEYIIADNPNLSPRAAVDKSKQMMIGRKWEYVKLYLSFIPWYIAANLFCCVGNFLIMPYVEETFTQFYLDLTQI